MIERLKSTIRPNTFENLNNGIWYYTYDIAEDNEEYSFIQVRINGEPTVSKCYKAILEYLSLKEDEDILYDIKSDFGLVDKLTKLEKEKRDLIRRIDEYDKSDNINSFYVNGNKVWLDKATRVGLMNSLTIEKSLGKDVSTLWFNNIKIDISIDEAIDLLKQVEMYALLCYNVTQQHKKEIDSLDNVDNYIYVSDYPETLSFTI